MIILHDGILYIMKRMFAFANMEQREGKRLTP